MSETQHDPNSTYWRSLAERDGAEEFVRNLEAEFPAEFPSEEVLDAAGVTRRSFLQVMGASIALAGLASCSWPEEEIIPFGKRPEGYKPGRLRHYASTLEIAGVARPVLVGSYDGRPIKVEGSPEHALSMGATDMLGQAAVLDVYDPDRQQAVRRRHRGTTIKSSWGEFEAFAASHFGPNADGTKIAVLGERTRSATTARLRADLQRQMPGMSFYEYEPTVDGSVDRGLSRTFGGLVDLDLDLSKAQIIADFDADLLGSHETSIRNAREFAKGRDLSHGPEMNRLYCFEPTWSVTGTSADHRAPVHAAQMGQVLLLLAAELRKLGHLAQPQYLEGIATLDALAHELAGDWQGSRVPQVIHALAKDLTAHGGKSVVVLGARHSASLHALAARINLALGNVGETIRVRKRPEILGGGRRGTLAELVTQINAGKVETLIMLGGNPVYDAPSDLSFAAALDKVATSIHLSVQRNETARSSSWFVPRAHTLESWGDVVAIDGSFCAVQPLIAPLHGGRTVAEFLLLLTGESRSAHDLARDTFHRIRGGEGHAPALDPGFEDAWRAFLHDGFVSNAFDSVPVATTVADDPLWADVRAAAAPALWPSTASLELQIVADRKVLDGRFANNAWLQELPDPVTKLTWDNAALLSMSLADHLGVKHGDVVRIAFGGGEVELPAIILPGQAPHTVTVSLGYGRSQAGRVGNAVGMDVGSLRGSQAMWGGLGATVTAAGRTEKLSCTQDHFAIDTRGRDEREMRVGTLVREGTLSEYKEHPEFAAHMGLHHPPLESLWKEFEFDGHAWGMSIDLNKCTGCNACVIACVAENNIAMVGKDQVGRGREMHWLRIDRYFQGDPNDPKMVHQPMACAQCEMAPCEQVCPVGATMHSEEGLNVMAYNRCVGTRYCSNNCPYKVRRFNYYAYDEKHTPLEKMAKNPEVTVRSRGVMEKCTYCVQRIEHGRINAKNERRDIRDGEIQPACQQTCPSQAIVFGDLALEGSEVSKQHADSRSYAALAELNIKPRTRYMARLRNPHPELAGAVDHGHSEPEHGGADNSTGAHG